MKKSTQVITLSLLAASLAGCRHPHHHYPTYGGFIDNRDEYYMDYGYGYGGMSYYYPVWYYPSFGYYNGHISNHTSVLYRTSTGYHATSGGIVSRANVSGTGSISTSRGGFGSSGHASFGG